MTYIQPLYPVLLFGAMFALVRQWRSANTRKPLALSICLIGLFLLSWPPVAWLASLSLEGGYEPSALPNGEAEAIVVLAGGYSPSTPNRPQANLAYDTYLRCRHAAWLHNKWRKVPVLVCGRSRHQPDDGPSISQVMRDALTADGVPQELIMLEDRSTSTSENALFGAGILREIGVSRIALVTEAFHMARAERCFRKQGIEVVPSPCAFRATRFEWRPRTFLPGSSAIRQNEQTLHEWIGMLWYRIRGRA